MPANGQIGYIKIAYAADASPQAWTAVPEIFDVAQIPNRIRDRIESTVHGTSGDRTYITGLSEVEDLVFTVRANMDAGSVHSTLRTYQANNTTLWFRVEVAVDPDFATSTFIAYQFKGRISAAAVNAPKDDLKTIEFTVFHTADLFIQDEMASAF